MLTNLLHVDDKYLSSHDVHLSNHIKKLMYAYDGIRDAWHRMLTYNKLSYKRWLYMFLCFSTARKINLKLVTVFLLLFYLAF